MKKKLLIICIILFSTFIVKGQTTCGTALPFCTGTNYTFPASTNTSAPSGPFYDCLGSQPNPAWYYMQIDNPGSITINIQGINGPPGTTPIPGWGGNTEDIDFICWGPFTNPATMCNQLTAANVEDCSFLPTWNEFCNINGASTGDYYVLLITNFSNSPCNITFSQTGGNSTTNCCILGGDAGDDNTLDVCDTDSPFNMWNQLLGNPDVGGNWYNDTWAATGNNNLDPATWTSGTYAYVVPGSSAACPDDTSFLTVNINPTPILSFPSLTNVCSDNAPINLTTATPVGGVYTGAGVNTNIFTPSINVLGSNTITYTYTDASGCSNTATQNIIVNDVPYATAVTTNVSCNGLTDGSATLTISGGTPTYATNWGGNNPLNLGAGTYGYTVIDNNNCTYSDSITIYQPGAFTATVNTTNISCNGANDGTASVQLQGSSAPAGTISTLSYCTSNPGSNTFSNIDNVQLLGDNYNINNNTAGLCDQYEDYTTTMFADITEGQAYTIDIDLGVCNGGNINNYPSGAKIFIDWNIDGDFTDPGEEVGNIPNGVAVSASIPITVPFTGAYGPTRMRVISQFQSIGSTTPITSCDVGTWAPTYTAPWFGATEDYSIVVYSATVTATYLWNNLSTTDSIYNLSAGNYSVNITDGNGCTLTDYITITEPLAISTSTSTSGISCNGLTDGNISLTINGGIPDYTINVPPYNQTLIGGVNTFITPSLLGAGTYNYSITDSNGCVFNSSVTLIEPAPISVTENQTDVSCNGGNDGSAILTINGGTPTYAQNWGMNNPLALSAGTANYQITDNNGCTYTDSVIITEPNLLTATFTQINVSTCLAADGSIDATISGGTTPYSYNWSNGSTAEDLSNLSGGIYLLTVTDNKGCTATLSVTITEPPSPILSFTQTDVSCNGGNNGSIDLTVNGGTSPFTYIWTTNEITQDISNLSAGQYTVQVSDDNSCTENITISITEPSAPSISTTQINVDCNGNNTGSIDLTVLGSLPVYTFLWSNGQTTEDIINLLAGNYSYTITDVNNCTYTNLLTISEPNALAINPLTVNVNCKGGNSGYIILNTSGGTAPYIEDFGTANPAALTAGNYPFTITDNNGCLYSNSINISEPDSLLVSASSTNATCGGYFDGTAILVTTGGTPTYNTNWGLSNPNGLNAGIHNYIVTDTNNCLAQGSVTITEPPGMQIIVDTFRVSCFGLSDGSATLTISAGAGAPYIQYWGTVNPNALPAGTHTFMITDSNNCTAQGDAIITQPADIQINELLSHVSCFKENDGTAFLQINGGISPYIENWNNVNTLALSAGSYSYSVTDANNCVKNNFITINEPDTLRATATIIDANCFNSDDGKIYLNISGGTSPYTEDFGIFNPFTLAEGSYNFTVTDVNGCSFDSSAVVKQANEVFLSFSAESPICRNDSTELSINIINPRTNLYTVIINDSVVKPYVIDSLGLLIPEGIKIKLNPNFTTDIILLTITDDEGCSSGANDTAHVIVNQLPVLDITLTDICVGSPSFTLNEGTPPGGNYFIDGKNTNFFDVENLENGAYTIGYNYTDIITNCNNSIEKIININPSPIADFSFSPQPANIDDPNILFINKSVNIENTKWNLGDGTILANELNFWHTYADTGKYEVIYVVNNQFNCVDSLTATLIINPVYQIFIPNSFTPNNDGDNDTFQPYINGAKNYTITIFDRWGEVMFQEENGIWDGKINGNFVQDGVYSYSILVNDFKNKPFIYTGLVTLLR